MVRREFIRSAAAGLATGALQSAAQERRPPNIIFILADDLGWGDTGCYGNQSIKTPNIDRLARQGTLFTQFYVNSPVCSPSRTAFMTGQYPARYRVHGHFAEATINEQRGMPNWLDPAAPFLPRVLKQHGYATAHFGKWHLGNGPGAPLPEAYGIEDSRTINSNGPTWEPGEGRDPFFRARSSSLIADESTRFIEKNRNHPFYLNFWSLVPHATLNPTEEQMRPYQRYGPQGVPHKGAMQIFYSSVADLDKHVGRVLDKLDESGLSENTLVLFSSDNGPEDIHITNASHSGVGYPGPFRGRKRSLYEGGVRSPFLVRWPGHVPAGRVDNTSVVTAVDFMPTLCRLAGVTPPQDPKPDGEDRGTVLLGQPSARSRAITWEWRFRIIGDVLNRSPMLAIREGNWKLLLNPDRSRVELYNIPEDPSELTNLADRHPEVVGRMADQVLAWQKTLPKGPLEPGAGRNDYPWPHGSARN
jgi:N-acetylgalactosamine-6-sulfatase